MANLPKTEGGKMTAQLSAHGRLTSDPGSKQTQSGKPMSWARMVANLPNKDSDNGESPLWLGLLAFGRVAEQLQRHSKGDMVSVSGTLQASSYTNQQGEQVDGFTLMVDYLVSARAVRPTGRPKQALQQQGTHSPGAEYQARARAAQDALYSQPGDNSQYSDEVSF
jgi:single-stranded DNA-binding protein